jgi:uncharacterized protein YkwD
MKKYILLLFLFAGLSSFTTSSPETESWTSQELSAANTAVNIAYMDSTERDIILYCNLARMYPAKFSRLEVADYIGSVEQPEQYKNSANKRTLMNDLAHSKATTALLPDSALEQMANCFQLELAASGNTGHDRKNCTEDYMAENCSFGKYRAKDIVLQLLIDEGVASLGHRKNILNPAYTKLGVAFGDHKKYRKCTVMDFR